MIAIPDTGQLKGDDLIGVTAERTLPLKEAPQITDAEASENIGAQAVATHIREAIPLAGELLKAVMRARNETIFAALMDIVANEVNSAGIPAKTPEIEAAINAGLTVALNIPKTPSLHRYRLTPAKITSGKIAAISDAVSPLVSGKTAQAITSSIVEAVRMKCHDVDNMLAVLEVRMDLVAEDVSRSPKIGSLGALAELMAQTEKRSEQSDVAFIRQVAQRSPEEYPDGPDLKISKLLSESLIIFGSMAKALGISNQLRAANQRPDNGSMSHGGPCWAANESSRKKAASSQEPDFAVSSLRR